MQEQKYWHVLQSGDAHAGRDYLRVYGHKWIVLISKAVLPTLDYVCFIFWPLLCPCSLTALTPLLCHLTSLPSSMLPVSADFSVAVSADLSHLYSQSGVSLISFGGAAGSRQVGMLPACLYPHCAEEILCICWSRPSLLRFVCFGDIFSLNENPPQRLMQPEAIWEVQAHLLSSLSHLPTILQSWQEGNKESRTRILLSDPLSQGGELAHLLSYIPFSYGCLQMSPLPTHPLLSQVLCRKMGIFLSSTACSTNLSHSSQECVLLSPLLCPTVPSPLCSGVQSYLLPTLFISSSAPKGSSGGDSASGSPWPQSVLSFDSVSLCWKCD